MKTLLSLLLIAGMMGTGSSQVHCVGFTGAMCDEAYPMNECGAREAIFNLPETGGTVYLGRGTIRMSREFCDDGEFRSALKEEPEDWLPSNRRWRITLDKIEMLPLLIPIRVKRRTTIIGSGWPSTKTTFNFDRRFTGGPQ